MNKFIDLMLLIMVAICLVGAVYSLSVTMQQKNHTLNVMYDCRIAEISPDVPLAVKEQCRRQMGQK